MNEVLLLALALSAGVLLGGIFFGGLWWTVRKGVSSTQPALWFFGSLLLRMSVTLTGLGFSGTLGAALEPEGAPAAVGLDEEAVGALDASLGVVVDGAAAGVAELCVEALEAGCELLQPATTESKSKASVAGRTEGERRRYVMDTFYSCLLVQKTPKRALSPLQSPRYFNML